ncbi:MAG: putative toxin-antitoxin system toxin component, PIN family, partial [Candidatus Hydrothermarchaeota archaeon]|nr:putative toxin-antitoxin system toxin component, PIN family [Candidatus Hydrothermarchaeota archaeon]
MKVVLDTNVLVSALITRGKSKKLFDKILEKKLDLALSEEMLIELKEVLKRPKFRKYVDKKRIDRFVDLVNKNLKLVKISSDFDVTI